MTSLKTSPFDPVACSTVNSAWGALTVEVLARLGVETIITSPGSRSTPLTIAAVRNPRVEALTMMDERSAGFFALGLAKRTWKPVALVCTSGSAVANYLPAVVEASMSGVPLILMTADRPPEMRDCSSGQTIDQFKIFGDYVRSFREMAIPEVSFPMLCYLRQSLVYAVSRSLGQDSGPIHMNFPFRDPLTPASGESITSPELLESAATVLTRPAEAVEVDGIVDSVAVERLKSHRRGLIVVGDVNPREDADLFAETIAELSRRLGWPVVADVLSPLRGYKDVVPHLITQYDAILRESDWRGRLQPTAVLQVGPLPTSKVFRGWLEGLDAVAYLLNFGRQVNTDPLHRVAAFLPASPAALLSFVDLQSSDPAWPELWSDAEDQAIIQVSKSMEEVDAAFEGHIARLLSIHAPAESSIFVASSMSVRYAEFFWLSSHLKHRIYGNRGANGIDGTLGTAMGVAHKGSSTILLTGDLAFLHDSNALLAAEQMKGHLMVIVVNNQGGGIFEYLPVSEEGSTFETHFATPQSIDFEALCRAHRVDYESLEKPSDLLKILKKREQQGISVLELKTDRKADVLTLRQILSKT